MKKYNIILMSILIMLSLAACGDNKDERDDTTSKTNQVTEKTETAEENKGSDTQKPLADEKLVDDTVVEDGSSFPHMDIEFTILGTSFNEYALSRNMKFLDLSDNADYISNAGLRKNSNDVLYADLAKTDYEGYIVNDQGLIQAKIKPMTYYNGSLASYLASEIDVYNLEVPVVISAGNKIRYLWECDNGYFTALCLVTDDLYNYNLNYILLEVAYFTDLEHCLYGDNIDFFLNQREDYIGTSTDNNTSTTEDNQVETEQQSTGQMDDDTYLAVINNYYGLSNYMNGATQIKLDVNNLKLIAENWEAVKNSGLFEAPIDVERCAAYTSFFYDGGVIVMWEHDTNQVTISYDE